MIFGSLYSDDTLKAIEVAAGGNLLQFDIEDLTRYINSLYLAHNSLLQDNLSRFVGFSNRRLWNARGNNNHGEFQIVGETGTVAMQKNSYTSQQMGVGMDAFQRKIGWTREAFLMMTPQQFRAENAAILDSDVRNVINKLRYAIFTGTNSTVYDYRTDDLALSQKAFANGDGFFYPTGAQGDSFSTHNHYLGRIGGALANADFDAAQNHLLEHYPNATIYHLVPRGLKSTVKALSEFNKYETVNVRPSQTDRFALGQTTSYKNNYADIDTFGEFNGAEVSACWWLPANYILTLIANPGDLEEMPLRFRTRGGSEEMGSTLPELYLPNGGGPTPGLGSLRVIQESETIFNATTVEREFGIAANNRLAVVITYTGGTSYVAPTGYTL